MTEYPYADGDKPTKEELESVVLEMKYTPQCNAVVREYEDEGVMFVLKVEDGEAYEVSMPIPKWVKVGQVVFRQPITITKEADTEWKEEFRNKILDIETAIRLTYNEKDSDAMVSKMTDFIANLLSSRDTYWKERVRKEVEGIKYVEPQGERGKIYNEALYALLDNLK